MAVAENPALQAAPSSERRAAFTMPRWADAAFLLVGIALLVWVISGYPMADIAHACVRLGPLLAVTPLIALGWIACNTAALGVLLGGRVPFTSLFWNRLVGDGYNALLPLAGLGGEPFKLRHLSRFVATDRAVAALIQDRVLENALGLLFSAGWIAIALGRFALPDALHVACVGYIIIATVIALICAALVLTRIPGRIGGRLARWLGAGAGQIEPLAPTRFALACTWYLAARVLGLLEIASLLWLLGLGVDPLTIGFADSFLNVAGFLGFAIPQGLGVFEGATIYLFGLLGFPGALGVAFALARRGRMLVVSLMGVGLHLVTHGRGGGRPQAKALWDRQYASGQWEYLDATDELAHYAVIAGYVEHLAKQPRILDVGCGHGRLFHLLRATPFESYLGTDVSTAAIARCKPLAGDTAQFREHSFEDDLPDGRFDVIIFNESLYYAVQPLEVLQRYATLLDDGGLLVVSMCHRRGNRAIWRTIDASFSTVHSTALENEKGQRWDVKVLRTGPARQDSRSTQT